MTFGQKNVSEFDPSHFKRIYTVILSILSRYRYLTVTERERECCPK